MNELKYKGYAIVLQEIPNEITLAFNICGCPYRCKGCHSQYLWDNDGKKLEEDFDKIVNLYKDYLTCICFMGGDWELKKLIKLKKKVETYKLKTAIYSGSDSIETFNKLKDFKFNYIKIGSYQEDLGGLNSAKTNQKMYMLIDNKYMDITNKFKGEFK